MTALALSLSLTYTRSLTRTPSPCLCLSLSACLRILPGQVVVALNGESVLGVSAAEVTERLQRVTVPVLMLMQPEQAEAAAATAGAAAIFGHELVQSQQEARFASKGSWSGNLEQLIGLCLEAQDAAPVTTTATAGSSWSDASSLQPLSGTVQVLPPPPAYSPPVAVSLVSSPATDKALRQADEERTIREHALQAVQEEITVQKELNAELSSVLAQAQLVHRTTSVPQLDAEVVPDPVVALEPKLAPEPEPEPSLVATPLLKLEPEPERGDKQREETERDAHREERVEPEPEPFIATPHSEPDFPASSESDSEPDIAAPPIPSHPPPAVARPTVPPPEGNLLPPPPSYTTAPPPSYAPSVGGDASAVTQQIAPPPAYTGHPVDERAQRDAAAYVKMGEQYMKSQNSAAAISAFQKALENDPGSIRAQQLLCQLQSPSSPRASAEPAVARWAWHSGTQWVPYEPQLNTALESAYQNFTAEMGPHTVDVGGGRHADFQTMKQVVTADPRRARKIQRSLPGQGEEGTEHDDMSPGWYWQSDSGWIQYDARLQRVLEEGFSQYAALGAPVTVDISDQRHVNFKTYRQVVTAETARQRAVRRVPGAAATAPPPLRPQLSAARSSVSSIVVDPPLRTGDALSQCVAMLSAPNEDARRQGLKLAAEFAARADQRAGLLATPGAIQSLVKVAKDDKSRKNRKTSTQILASTLESRFDWSLVDLVGVAVSGVLDQRVFETASQHVLACYRENSSGVEDAQLVQTYLQFIVFENQKRLVSSAALLPMFETLALAANTVSESQTHAAAFEHGAIALVGAVSRHGGAIARLCVECMSSLAASPQVAAALAASGAVPILCAFSAGGTEELQLGLGCLVRLVAYEGIARRAAAEPRLAPLLLSTLNKINSHVRDSKYFTLQLLGAVIPHGDFKRAFLDDSKSLDNMRRLSLWPAVMGDAELTRECGQVLSKVLDDSQGLACRKLASMLRTELFTYLEHYDEAVLSLVVAELYGRVTADSEDPRVLQSKYCKPDRLRILLTLLCFDGKSFRVNRIATQILGLLCNDGKIQMLLASLGVAGRLVQVLDVAIAVESPSEDAAVQLQAFKQEGLGLLLRISLRGDAEVQKQFTQAGGIRLLSRVLANSDEQMISVEAALQLVMKLSQEPALHGEMCVSGLLKCLHDLPAEFEGTSCAAMCNIAGGAVVGKDLQYERLYKVATAKDSVEVLIWAVQKCTKPAAIDVRIAGVQAVGHLSLFSISSQRSSARMDTGPPMALSKCIDCGIVGTLTDMLAAGHDELVDAALDTLTHLSESETDGRTFSSVPIVDAALGIVGSKNIKRVNRAVRLLCRVSVANPDYAHQVYVDPRCGLVRVLRAAFDFKFDCGHLLCIWSRKPQVLAEMVSHHSVVGTMTAFAIQVSNEDQLAHAVTGFEMLLMSNLAMVVDEDGIMVVWKMAESEHASSDVRARCLTMLTTIAVDGGGQYKGRMQTDGAVQFLRRIANSSTSARPDVEAATKILSTLGVKDTSIQDGTTIMMTYPDYWTPFTSDYEEVDVPRGSAEFNHIHDKLNETIEQHNSGYGCIPGTTEDPVGFEVLRIIRLQNKTQWTNYFFKKRALWAKYRDLPSFESSQHMEKFPSRMPCLDKSINEYHLWHGTSWNTVEIIKKYGLDPRVSSVMGMFGGGCYFAEDSSKSNQYIPCPTCGKGAIFRAKSEDCKCKPNLQEFPMVLCRVLLGDIHVVKKYDVDKYRGVDASRPVRRPPNKPNSMEAYDSILGETQKNGATAASRKQRPLQFREYITYDDSCSYPEYIITYKRRAQVQLSLMPPPMPTSAGMVDSPPVGGGSVGGAFAVARVGASAGEYIFTVPLHAVPGEAMQVQLPDGRTATCTLPAGAMLGAELQINVPG